MKTIDELIKEGYEIRKSSVIKGYAGEYMNSEEYQHWLEYCTRYLQQIYPKDIQTDRFSEIAKKANGYGVEVFNSLIGILNAIKEIPAISKDTNIDSILEKILKNFHRCAKSILNRHGGRQTLEIKDEYDVQDLLQGILRLFIDDVRPEDYVPSYAGGNSRTDFYLPQYNTYIEVKMTREGLSDKEIGEQLAVDVARYGEMCDTLVCFIYDKISCLKNPYGLIHDLEKLSSDRMKVKVYISPL